MTDRLNALIVVLDRDLRTDDAQALIDAIHQFRFVLSVSPHLSDLDAVIARDRVRHELIQKLYKVLEADIS